MELAIVTGLALIVTATLAVLLRFLPDIEATPERARRRPR